MKIERFFRLLNIGIDECNTELINTDDCLILSTWHPDPKLCWLENLKTIRRQGILNPIIILSVESKSFIYSQITLITEGVHFLRLPFNKLEFDSLKASLSAPDISTLKQVQNQLYLDDINFTWKSLRHGNQLEIINSIFYPLRIALLLDTDAIEKKKIVTRIVNGTVSRYWQLPEIISLRRSSELMNGSNVQEAKIHDFFFDIDALLGKITSSALFEDEEMVNTIDNLICSFHEIDKLIN
jgi:hypothetical protein